MLKALWQEEKFDLIAFFIIFLIVGFLVFESFSGNIQGVLDGPFKCSQFDNNYAGCVQAQQSAKGCAWYAECGKCFSEGTDTAQLCK